MKRKLSIRTELLPTITRNDFHVMAEVRKILSKHTVSNDGELTESTQHLSAVRRKLRTIQNAPTAIEITVTYPSFSVMARRKVDNYYQESKTVINRELKRSIRDAIRRYREDRKNRSYEWVDVPGLKGHVGFYLMGGVHKTAGDYLTAFKVKRRRINEIKKQVLIKSKKPKNGLNHVGVEIEFISSLDRNKIEDLLCEADLHDKCTIKDDGSIQVDGHRDCDGSCQDNCECCTCCRCGETPCENEATCSNCRHNEECTDESCDERECECVPCDDGENCNCDCECECTCTSDEYGHEVTILSTQADYQKDITALCKVLKKADARVNKSCGMHVHIDARNRDAATIYRRLVLALPVIAKVVPASRRDNRYCKLNAIEYWNHTDRTDRYQAINPNAFSKYGTIEVRLHSATTAPKKINYWINLLLRIVDDKKLENLVEESRPKTVGELAKVIKIPKKMYQYYLQRQRQFSRIGNEEAS